MSPEANIAMGKIYKIRFERFLAYLKREAEAVATKVAEARAELEALQPDPRAELEAQLLYERQRHLAEVRYEQQRRKAVARDKDVLEAKLERANQRLEDAELLSEGLQDLWAESMKSLRRFARTSGGEHGERLEQLLETKHSELANRRTYLEVRALESEAALVARLMDGESAFVEELRKLEALDQEALLKHKADGLEPHRSDRTAAANEADADRPTAVRSLKDLDKLDLGGV